MSLVFVMVGIVIMCGLLCLTELLVQILEKAGFRPRTAVRRPVYVMPQAKVTRLPVSGALPDRDAISNVYSLSDHFADHFQKVVNS